VRPFLVSFIVLFALAVAGAAERAQQGTVPPVPPLPESQPAASSSAAIKDTPKETLDGFDNRFCINWISGVLKPGSCGHEGPKSMASRTPVQATGFFGGMNRPASAVVAPIGRPVRRNSRKHERGHAPEPLNEGRGEGPARRTRL